MINTIDISILNYIASHLHTNLLDKIMPLITYLGDKGFIWILIAVILIISQKYRKVGFVLLGALLLSTMLGEGILKHIIRRLRPCATIPASKLLITKPLSFSFPSGHTTSSFAAASVLSKFIHKYKFAFFILASAIAFSRVYLYVHYPSDILGGIVLGLICAKITIFYYNKLNDKSIVKSN